MVAEQPDEGLEPKVLHKKPQHQNLARPALRATPRMVFEVFRFEALTGTPLDLQGEGGLAVMPPSIIRAVTKPRAFRRAS